MGLLEKFKNMFTEEVEETEPIKKEMLHVEIPSPAVKEEKKEEKEEVLEEPIVKIEKKPTLFFDDDDFKALDSNKPLEETRTSRLDHTQPRTLYGGDVDLYKEKRDYKEPVKEEKKEFKPTPIISPIYGILDKNYEKEDIVEKKPTKAIDYFSAPEESPIDAIRKKAFGTLEDDLETTLFGKNSIFLNNEDKEEDKEIEEINIFEEPVKEEKSIITELNENDIPIKKYRETREVEIEIGEAKDEKIEELDSKDLFGPSILTDDLEEENEEVKRPKDLVDDSELFNLIDSMYESRDEKE